MLKGKPLDSMLVTAEIRRKAIYHYGKAEGVRNNSWHQLVKENNHKIRWAAWWVRTKRFVYKSNFAHCKVLNSIGRPAVYIWVHALVTGLLLFFLRWASSRHHLPWLLPVSVFLCCWLSPQRKVFPTMVIICVADSDRTAKIGFPQPAIKFFSLFILSHGW